MKKSYSCLIKVVSLVAVLLTMSADIMAALSVYSVKGVVKVKVKSSGQIKKVVAGMTLKPNDELIIPDMATVSILNDQNNKVYDSVKSGNYTVMSLMIDARGVSKSSLISVTHPIKVLRSPETAQKVYTEKGVARRATFATDAEGRPVRMDASVIGSILASRLKDAEMKQDVFPVYVESASSVDCGKSLSVSNSLDIPVFFNIVKQTGDAASALEISELGQPGGAFVLLPEQSLVKNNLPSLAEGSRHILIMAHSDFDVNEVIRKAAEACSSAASSLPGESDTVYIMEL